MSKSSASALQRLADIDARLFLAINKLHRYLRLERLVRLISFTGDGHFYVALGVTLAFLYPLDGQKLQWVALLGFAIELPIYWVLKNSFRRRRPFNVVKALAPLLKPSDEFSFPSGHTAAAFMMACCVSAFFPSAVLPMYLWASLIGISRVMLRVHFLSDILAGMVLGTSVALICLSVLAD
jgi:undecaprenyl-diphosphatase